MEKGHTAAEAALDGLAVLIHSSMGTGDAESTPPTWSTWNEIFRVIGYGPFLSRTTRIALIVGSVLFVINHLDEVITGRATMLVWVKGMLTYLVPFCVSNCGVLVATRRKPEPAA